MHGAFTMKEIIGKVEHTISRYNMVDPGDRVIVAVSGGPDSVCLLDILHELELELGISLVVAHFDHGLRPGEDEAETDFVKELSKSMKLPFEIEKASFSAHTKGSLEEKAREARYAFFERARRKHNAQKIALGHNLDDQAETIIMRLLRGSGPKGLSGIPPCRGGVFIRPLIELRRADIRSYLCSRNLKYFVDSSNLQPGYLRNKIRLELMPVLEKYQPRLAERLSRMAEILGDESRYLDLVARSWLGEESRQGAEGLLLLPLLPFLKLPPAIRNRVAREAINKVKGNLRRISHKHIRAINALAEAAEPQGILNLPDGLAVRKRYGSLVFSSESEGKAADYHYELEGPGEFYLKEIGKTIRIKLTKRKKNLTFDRHPWRACLDAAKVKFPLVARNLRPGDRFVPLGMTGHKKLKDFFVDLKVPSDIRASTPLLFSGKELAWVCGFRIDERFKVTKDTQELLEITLD